MCGFALRKPLILVLLSLAFKLKQNKMFGDVVKLFGREVGILVHVSSCRGVGEKRVRPARESCLRVSRVQQCRINCSGCYSLAFSSLGPVIWMLLNLCFHGVIKNVLVKSLQWVSKTKGPSAVDSLPCAICFDNVLQII